MENKTLVILPQIEDLPYPLKSEELAHLERGILAEGVRDPLVVWDRGDEAILIDGHHRYAIAKKHGIEYEVKAKQFADREDVLDWTIKFYRLIINSVLCYSTSPCWTHDGFIPLNPSKHLPHFEPIG